MNKRRFATGVVGAFIFLDAASGLTQAQSSVLKPALIPQRRANVARPTKHTRPVDDLAGLTLTDDQKAKIDQIRQALRLRMEAVMTDEKSTPWQKQAMLEGLRRTVRSQVFEVLTPDQQLVIRKKIAGERAAEREENKKIRQESLSK